MNHWTKDDGIQVNIDFVQTQWPECSLSRVNTKFSPILTQTDFLGVPTSSMRNSYTNQISSSNHMRNHESTPPHSPLESWNNNQFKSHLSNGDFNFIEDAIETDHRYQATRPHFPPSQPTQHAYPVNHLPHRQIPSLIKADAICSQRKANGSTLSLNRQKLSNVPELYRIQRPVDSCNGHRYFQQTSSTQRPRPSYSPAATNFQHNHLNLNNRAQPAFNNLSSANNYYTGNSLSLKQNVDSLMKENVIRIFGSDWESMKLPTNFLFLAQQGLFGQKTAVTEKSSYDRLLKMIPFYSKCELKIIHLDLKQFPHLYWSSIFLSLFSYNNKFD